MQHFGDACDVCSGRRCRCRIGPGHQHMHIATALQGSGHGVEGGTFDGGVVMFGNYERCHFGFQSTFKVLGTELAHFV
jgi:hypothetical protein